MARQRKLSLERKAFISRLLEHYQPDDVQEMLKDLLGYTLKGILEGKFDLDIPRERKSAFKPQMQVRLCSVCPIKFHCIQNRIKIIQILSGRFYANILFHGKKGTRFLH